MLDFAFEAGANWRRIADETAVLDLRLPSPLYLPRTRHYIAAVEMHAVFTRDEGYFFRDEPFLPHPAFDRCLHLSISYGKGRTWRHRHDITQAACQGAFGIFLPHVWVQDPMVGGDVEHDRWHFRLFMDPTWAMPVAPRTPIRPLTYISWQDYIVQTKAPAIARG